MARRGVPERQSGRAARRSPDRPRHRAGVDIGRRSTRSLIATAALQAARPASAPTGTARSIELDAKDELYDCVVAFDPELDAVRFQIPVVALARGEPEGTAGLPVAMTNRIQVDLRSGIERLRQRTRS